MANKRRLRLERYGISNARYAEMRAFCRQYNEWQRGRWRGTQEQRSRCAQKADLLLTVAMVTVNGEENVLDALLKNITDGIPYAHLNVPLSEGAFYALRRDFFINLNKEI